MEGMKILITTDWYKPIINGVVTSVVTLKEQLEGLGCRVRVVTLSGNGHAYRDGDVYYLPSVNASRIYPGARAVCPPCRGIGEILAWKPDLIHSQCEFSSFLIAKWIGEKLRIPIVHTYHTVYEDYTHYFSAGRPWGKQAAALFSRFILERTDRVIVPTKKVAGLLAGYGVDRPMEVIPTGIRTERFVPIRSGSGAKEQQAERSRIRQSLGIGEEKTVLLALGRLAKEKNLEELITFFGRLDEPGMELVIAGDGPERKALEALAGQQKGRERIHIAAMIPFEETPAWYRAADLFVCASRSETQGITYLEALSAGLPVICRKDECVEGIVMDGLNGCVYENWMDFSLCCRLLAQDPGRRDLFGARAIRTGMEYSAQRFGERVLQAYGKTLRERTPGWRENREWIQGAVSAPARIGNQRRKAV